jgi:UDP:flavonoid glycosyltransferase YjiC (YdhE family)
MAALAVELASRGHDTRLITHRGCADLVEGSDVDLRTLDGDMRDELASVEGRQLIDAGRNAIAAIRAARTIGRRNLERWWVGIREETGGAEILVCETTSLGPMHAVAEVRGLPCVTVGLQPMAPTGAFPHPFAPPPRWRLPNWGNRQHHHLVNQVLWQTTRSLVNDGRREIFDLPPWSVSGPFGRFRREARPMLMAYSHQVLPRPIDWDAGIDVTGYWFLDSASGWRPRADLSAFLDGGSAPVYVGFGSMSLADPEATTATVLAAIAEAGCRAVIATGWGGLAPKAPPSNVFILDEAPHDWLFPRMAAVVHHGGAGTTAAALRAGVPSVVVPFMADQFFWANILAEKGVAPQAVPRARLSTSALARGIAMTLDDGPMRRRAIELGALIAQEDGVGRAADRVEAAGVGGRTC